MVGMSSALPDVVNDLRKIIQGEVRTDLVTRLLYSTDASIYQIEPLGVIFPRTEDELEASMAVCAKYGVPVLPRGAGSSLAGQAIGPAIILDCSRYLNRALEINVEQKTAMVQPGLVLSTLNRMIAPYGLQFGPDPASAERATLGGCLANNATGAHSICYGMAADHLLSTKVVLADGTLASFSTITLDQALTKSNGTSREARFFSAALQARQELPQALNSGWPETWRKASGYNVNYLIPWSPSTPPRWHEFNEFEYPPVGSGNINLSHLLAGCEGTLAIIQRATVGLVRIPKHTILGVLSFESILDACIAVPQILDFSPTAIELIPQSIVRLARSSPAYAKQLRVLQDLGDPAAMLIIEFSGNEKGGLSQQVAQLNKVAPVWIADEESVQRQIWNVRKVGLGILLSRAGDVKPWSFVEDLAVPVDQLGEFYRGMEQILHDHNTTCEVYAHASSGCLHIRPMINLKTPQGVADLRSIASSAVQLTINLGGSVSGEHGDGLARSEWLDQMYGPQVVRIFRQIKDAADPENLLNPGKITTPLSVSQELPRMDQNLRFGTSYHAKGWAPFLDFSHQGGLAGAIEQCNGAGVCRKNDGVMCPSFQATQDEMHSTRGRSNLLRALISGRFEIEKLGERAVYEALDLCLACKGCKSECPSSVDVAKLKYEFLNYYYSKQGNQRRLRDYLFGYIAIIARAVHPVRGLANEMIRNLIKLKLFESLSGLTNQRSFPIFSDESLTNKWHLVRQRNEKLDSLNSFPKKVLFLSDAFTEYFYPEVGLAALKVLHAVGFAIEILPIIGAGRTLLSKGFLPAARKHAQRLLKSIEKLDPNGQAIIIGVEPSEIYTLIDEYPDLLPNDECVRKLRERVYMIDEYLSQQVFEVNDDVAADKIEIMRIANATHTHHEKVLLHGHCYQKARRPEAKLPYLGVAATKYILELFGYQVEIIDAGCCGMAGAFGYEKEHVDLSMKVGELGLFPLIRSTDEKTWIAASGVSCRSQILDGANRKSVHPIELVARLI
jgi:FAD/FMN-containing dehydrogenase/Fe-S oxidoreductase